jgi:hypothetical protein
MILGQSSVIEKRAAAKSDISSCAQELLECCERFAKKAAKL